MFCAFFCLFYIHVFIDRKQSCLMLVAPSSRCSSVFLSQSQSQGGQELVHAHVDLGGEVGGVLDGQNYKNVVGEDLEKTQKKD